MLMCITEINLQFLLENDTNSTLELYISFVPYFILCIYLFFAADIQGRYFEVKCCRTGSTGYLIMNFPLFVKFLFSFPSELTDK